jgi:hypothetical protein
MTYYLQITISHPVTENDVLANVIVHYQPCERAGRDYPGCNATLEIESVTDAITGKAILIDENVTSEIENAVEERVESEKVERAIDRYESMRD